RLVEGEPVRRRDAGGAQVVLGQRLVDAAHAGGDARAGEGDAEDFEQLLGGAVLAAEAVHGDKGDVGPLVREPPDERGVGLERQHLVPEPLQRVLDPRPRAQRDASLQRPSPFEDGDLHSPSAFLNGTTFSEADSAGCSGEIASCSPVNALYSSTCSAIVLPMRRIPSRISSSPLPEKLSRIELRPRSST